MACGKLRTEHTSYTAADRLPSHFCNIENVPWNSLIGRVTLDAIELGTSPLPQPRSRCRYYLAISQPARFMSWRSSELRWDALADSDG